MWLALGVHVGRRHEALGEKGGGWVETRIVPLKRNCGRAEGLSTFTIASGTGERGDSHHIHR